jgi:hypothetical protein
MELRFEAYNLFNHPNFANPYLPTFIADAAQQGIDPATGRSTGYYHLTATGDVGIGYPFLGSGGPRSLQIAAKFNFEQSTIAPLPGRLTPGPFSLECGGRRHVTCLFSSDYVIHGGAPSFIDEPGSRPTTLHPLQLVIVLFHFLRTNLWNR